MKLIVQIPCYNEAETLGKVVSDLPRSLVGIDEIETLVVDDGSVDGTSALAADLGVNHVVRHHENRGLAAAFSTGLDACISLGADIIVNTDGDNQYPGQSIPEMIQPILENRADLVIGDRRPSSDHRSSFLKRKLQSLGSTVVCYLAHGNIPDPVSGFRAYSREAAIRTNIVTNFSYTIESVLQAKSKGLAIEFVPIEANDSTRPSRLFHSIPHFVSRSAGTMLRVFFMYRPLSVLMWMSFTLATIGLVPIIRFLTFWFAGNGQGHIQSLVLGGVLIVMATLLAIAGLLADLIAANRRLTEMTLEKVKRIESGIHSTSVTNANDVTPTFPDNH